MCYGSDIDAKGIHTVVCCRAAVIVGAKDEKDALRIYKEICERLAMHM